MASILAHGRLRTTTHAVQQEPQRATSKCVGKGVLLIMYDRHQDVTDEDLGIRAFQIKRAKAVERAIERIRHGLGDSWKDLNNTEIEELEWVLGELWSYIAREDWDQLHFGRMTMSDIIKTLTLGSQMRRHARPSFEVLARGRGPRACRGRVAAEPACGRHERHRPRTPLTRSARPSCSRSSS